MIEQSPLENSTTYSNESTIETAQSASTHRNTGLIVAVIMVGVAVVFGFGGYYLGMRSSSNNEAVALQTQVVTPLPTPLPTQIPTTIPSPTGSPVASSEVTATSKPVKQEIGASVEKIGFKLPPNWESKIDEKGLWLEPINKGGFFLISTHTYPTTIGRREYYCQVTKFCIDGTTEFTPMKLGNISGYRASSLDNSGGGEEYFGSKGTTFYIISTYNPPSPNDFETNFQQVLSSLEF